MKFTRWTYEEALLRARDRQIAILEVCEWGDPEFKRMLLMEGKLLKRARRERVWLMRSGDWRKLSGWLARQGWRWGYGGRG